MAVWKDGRLRIYFCLFDVCSFDGVLLDDSRPGFGIRSSRARSLETHFISEECPDSETFNYRQNLLCLLT